MAYRFQEPLAGNQSELMAKVGLIKPGHISKGLPLVVVRSWDLE